MKVSINAKATNKIIRLNIFFLIILFLIILSAKLFTDEKYTDEKIIHEAYGLNVIQEILPEESPLRTNNLRKIKYIVIHETGNPSPTANAHSHSNYLLDGGDGNGTAWHYTVDENIAYHHIPDNEVAFHAGRGNKWGVGIELCVNRGADFEKTFVNGAKLTAKLIKTYGLSTNDIKQHGDFMNKNCPENIRNSNRWNEFLLLVEQYLKEL